MKIAARELNLLGLTLAVVVLALTYLALEPKFREWTEFRERRADLLARQELAQRRLDSRPDVEARLEEFRRGLPVFAAGKKAEAELLQALEKTAGQHELRLTRREADAERQAGDLYETAITCYWEGHLIGPLLMKNPHVNAYFTELLCRRAGLPYQAQDCPHEQRAYEVTLRALQERFRQQ